MKIQEFISQLEKDQLVKAVQEAERGNSGDVVLFVSHKKVEDGMIEARKVFLKLKLAKTTPQNSVLIFLAPKSQKFAVLGGSDLYRDLPASWWPDLVAKMAGSFAGGRMMEGLLTALGEIGQMQRQYFPADASLDRSGQENLLEES